MILDFFKYSWQYFVKPITYRHRKPILSVLIAVIAVMWIGTSQGFFRSPFSKINAFESMSEHVALILETNNYTQTLENIEEKAYYKDLASISMVQKWERGLRFIDSLFHATDSYANLLAKAHVVSGGHIISNEEANWLYAFDQYEEEFDVKDFLHELMPSNISKSIYRDRTIYKLEFGNGQKISMAVFYGLILISPATILVESGIEQLDNIESNALRNHSFLKAKSHTNEAAGELSVYFNLKSIPSLTSVVTKSNPRAIMNLMAIGAWVGMDTRFLENGFVMSGHLYPEEGHRFLQALAKEEAPKDSKIAEYIPKNMGALLYFGWKDFEPFYESYKDQEYKDFEQYFMPWIGREITLMFRDPTDSEGAFAKDKLVFVHCKDTGKAWKGLNQYAHQFGELSHLVYQNFEIYQIAANSPFQPIFGADLAPLQNPYYTILGDYVIFANSMTAMEGWIKSYNSNQMILSLPEYHAFFKQAQTQSNIYALLSTPNSTKFLQYFMRENLHPFMQEAFKKFRNIYPIGIQFFGLEEHFLVTLSASHNLVKEQEVNRASNAWEADLATDAAIAPQVLASHDGSHYIFVQDKHHRLYLFDKNGENLWPKEKVITRTVNSEVFEVDFHNNGELQYAFSTDSAIYVMDKAGRDIKIIPLISRAANGVLAVNYGKGPRFFIACKNGSVYGYEENGKPLSGFQPLQRVGRIDYPMEFMLYKEKRYFIMANRSGNCQAYERAGEPYFRGGKLGHALRGWGVDPMIGRIAGCSPNGKIRVLNTAGKGFGFFPIPGMKKDVQFIYADVIGDARKDYIRISPDKMAVHYYTKEKDKKGKVKDQLVEAGIYDLEAPGKRSVFEVSIVGATKKYIGFLEPENGSISLLNYKGEVQNGFPLAGTSTFEVVDLFEENGNTLVVANKDKVFAYKLKL